MWDLPRPEIEPVSPSLAGRFFTTEPPEKPLIQVFENYFVPKKSGREFFLASDQQFCYCVNQRIFNLLCQEIIKIILSHFLQLGTPEVKSLFSYRYGKVKVKSLSHVRLFATPWTVAYKSPQSMEFSRQNTGVGCHFLLQGIFLTQGSNLVSHIAGRRFTI